MTSEDTSSTFDSGVPHPARRYDYWLGGKDNFAADRTSGDAVEAQFPTIRVSVRENRWFLHRAVAFAARQEGLRQFLDIGTGIPTSPNTHQIAQQADPTARIVYADNDPIVLAHARALLTGTPEGRTTYLDADLRQPAEILRHPGLRATIDLSQPVALMLIAVLHFLRDDENPRAIIDTLIDALAPGSLVIASHATLEHLPADQAEAITRADGRAHPRPGTALAAFFDRRDLQPVEPVKSVSRWWPDAAPQPRPTVEDVACNGFVARVVPGAL
ncbi:SAM-dependent methyltransferase [Actinoplanes sp. NPDC051411]|uniref:SAM-dependent methyltransferase n=1 Tax=Actinoplanes sp. NPDC051411 TaxID=3155522 RepID=UPI00343899EE